SSGARAEERRRLPGHPHRPEDGHAARRLRAAQGRLRGRILTSTRFDLKVYTNSGTMKERLIWRNRIMANVKLIAIRCQISFFSPYQRFFRIQAADGTTYMGIADREYCFTPEGAEIPDDVPKRGELMPGLVAAREVQTRDDGKTVLVDVP